MAEGEASSQDDRRAKLERLRADGVDPFPHEFANVVPIEAVRGEQEGLEAGEETDSHYRLAGRLAARRGHGQAALLYLGAPSGPRPPHARADGHRPECLPP